MMYRLTLCYLISPWWHYSNLIVQTCNLENRPPDAAQAGRENSDPLPNPWAPRTTSSTSTASSSTPTTSTTSTSQSTTTTSSSSSASTTSGNLGGGLPGMFQSPGMQSLMQQMMENPQLMSSMINAPYTQAMFQVSENCTLLVWWLSSLSSSSFKA